jgi:hypothetical protein
MLSPLVKITPRNQTLILAGERFGPRAKSGNTRDAGARVTVRSRVTIVAARPDATVLYVQADYREATAKEAIANAAPPIQSALVPLTGQQPQPARRNTGLFSLTPAEQYANIQRMPLDAPTFARIDVYA